MPPRSSPGVGGENPEFVLQNFKGVNNRDAREAINDDEFYWCENLMPLGDGNLVPTTDAVLLAGVAVTETGPPSYSYQASTAIADFVFAVWKNSGNAWIVNLVTGASTKIVTASLTSGQTFATSYNAQGLLIVDPAGYWDYNVTTPATLTAQNNSAVVWALQSATSVAGNSTLKQILTVTGSGGAFQTLYTVTAMINTAGGAGFAVGDALNFTDNNPITPAQIIVSAIGGGGAITGFTIATGGSYPGPTSSALVNVGPSGSTWTTTGAGTGATFTTSILATSVKITTRGTGYANTDTLTDQTAGSVVKDTFKLTTSGVISGTSIATYAGRVWIGFQRTVNFTDINSYNYFGGAGGSFTINDAYLHQFIMALFGANNYLYIFGDDSIDALSNVTVSPSTGLTSFSRVNVTASIGCSQPTSIFAYFRGVAFYWNNGFYLLSGATPEKISDKILGTLNQLLPVGGSFANNVYGCQVVINSELCAAFLFSFNDIFTVSGGTRSIFAVYFRQKWWFYSVRVGTPVGAIWCPIFGKPLMFFWVNNALYQAFATGSTFASVGVAITKLWDGGSIMREKQSINVAIAAFFTGAPTTSITYTVDTEAGAGATLYTSPSAGVGVGGYQTLVQASAQGGGRFLGLTVNPNAVGTTLVSRIAMIAMRGKTERDVLQ